MCSVRTITAPEAADLIVDGAVVTVSSSSGMGCPDAVLAAIGERFQRAGHPQNITSIHPIAASRCISNKIPEGRFLAGIALSLIICQINGGAIDDGPEG